MSYKLGPAWPVRHSARSARAVEAAFRARLWGRAVFNFAADCVLGRWVTIYHHAYHTARAFRVPVPSAPVPSSRPLGRLAMQCARARQLSGRGRPRPTSRTRSTSTMARPCAGRAAPLLQLRFASSAAAAARNHDRLRARTCVREQTHASDGWAAFRCITHPLPYPSPRSARPTMTPAAAADRTRSEPRPPACDNLRA